MFWDAVFGLNVAHWDERRLSREEWTEFFKQVAVINTATNFAAAFYCYYVQLGELREVMEEAGYSGFEVDPRHQADAELPGHEPVHQQC